jgi:hypothetical protein
MPAQLSIRAILPHIDSYPEPTSAEAADRAITIAGPVGGTPTGLVAEVAFPMRSYQVADCLIGLTGKAHGAEARCRRQCSEILLAFAAAASAAGVLIGTLRSPARLFEVPVLMSH